MKTWEDTGALVVLKRYKRSTAREWVLLAIALVALCLSGCSQLSERPMSQYNCAGWRTLPDGSNECTTVTVQP